MDSENNLTLRNWVILLAICIIGILVITAYIFLQAGQGAGPAPPAAAVTPATQITIGLSLSEDYPFFIALRQGAEESAALHGARIITAENPHEDPEKQAAGIRRLADEGIDVLLLNPTANSQQLIPVIEELHSQKIPVITVDRPMAGGPVTCHISSDNVAGGRMAGEFLAETMGREGKIVEIEGVPNSSAAIERGRGFNEAIGNYKGIVVVARKPADFNRTMAKAVFLQILNEQPEIGGVFAHNDDMILGAIDAAKEAGRAGPIIFVGFDAIGPAVDAVEAGDLEATIAQQPADMGRLGVETAMKCVKGENVPPAIPVGLALVSG